MEDFDMFIAVFKAHVAVSAPLPAVYNYKDGQKVAVWFIAQRGSMVEVGGGQ